MAGDEMVRRDELLGWRRVVTNIHRLGTPIAKDASFWFTERGGDLALDKDFCSFSLEDRVGNGNC